MNRTRFEELVEEALTGLPQEFASQLDNITIMVEDLPTHEQIRKVDVGDPHHLLGLYEGVNLTNRPLGYSGFLPDRITIFRIPIEEMCATEDQIRDQVRKTVMHELGHYFGMDEDRLERLEEE